MSSTDRLSRLLRPQSIAVCGGRWAEEVLRQCRRAKFGGELWPIHPRRRTMAGVRCRRSVEELPRPPDAAFVAVNRRAAVEIIGQLSRIGGGGAVCFASGFGEAGREGRLLQKKLLHAAGDMPVLGPNCYGFLNYCDNALLWPDQHGGAPVKGGIAVISQSGNIGLNVTMQRRGLPLAYLLTTGNQTMIDAARLIETLLADRRVRCIGLILESIVDGGRFESAARQARAQKIPLLALKLGASKQGAAAALSHTASLAGDSLVSAAFFRRLGVGLAHSLPVFLETLKLLDVGGVLGGRKILSMSCSGGEAAMVADAVSRRRLTAKPFSARDKKRIRKTLNELVAVSNPLDYHTFIWGDKKSLTATYRAAMDGEFDLSLLILDFPHPDKCDDANWRAALEALAAASRQSGARAALVSSLPECLPESVRHWAATAGIAMLAGIDEALCAAQIAADMGERWRRKSPRIIFAPPRGRRRKTLNEFEGKKMLAQYGIATPPAMAVGSARAAAAAAVKLGFPVAVKTLGVLHKTDVGGVQLNCRREAEVLAAAGKCRKLGAAVLVEKMIVGGAAELFAGVRRDSLGLALIVGEGGSLVEMRDDKQCLLLPAAAADVREALLSLRIAPLLRGHRGLAKVDIAGAVDTIMNIARLAMQQAVEDMDINPLLAMPKGGAVALDAFITLREE